ncbi:MAG: hypothetical protein ACYCUM_00505 [Solirubrobacteraceae bacterium]
MHRVALVRNIAVLLVIAAVVEFVPGGGRAASTVGAILWAGFAAAIGWIGIRLYREHRIALYSLGSSHRALLYGAVALGAFLLAGRGRMWQSGGVELLWFALLGAAIYALVVVYRYWRSN